MSRQEVFDAFTAEFKSLQSEHRWPAFAGIAKRLVDIDGPVHIVETGCARQEGNWQGDGQSTVMWGWLAERLGGSVATIDISRQNLDVAKRLVPSANAICSDSITALRSLPHAEQIDLLYLDSYDVTHDYRAPLHHMGELAAIYDRLKSGCLIAVDDAMKDYGKDLYVKIFFADNGIKPIINGYTKVWEKP